MAGKAGVKEAELVEVKASDIETAIKPYEADKDKVVVVAEKMEVTSTASLSEAEAFAANIKRGLSGLEKDRVSWTKPLNDQVKRLNDRARKISEGFEKALDIVNSKIFSWRAREKERIDRINKEREEKERIERERIEAEARKEKERKEREAEEIERKKKEELERIKEKERRIKEEAEKAARKKTADAEEIERKKKVALRKAEEEREAIERQARQDKAKKEREIKEAEAQKKKELKKNEEKHEAKEQVNMVGNTAFKKYWQAKVTDPKKLMKWLLDNPGYIDQYIEFKTPEIKKMAIATNGTAKIPGVEFYQTDGTATRG